MKTKLVILALLSAFSINAAADNVANGQLGVSYATETYFRGSQTSEDAIKLQVGGNTAVGGVDVFADILSVQNNNGGNVDYITLGLGKTLNDTVSLYGGVLNVDADGASSQLDVFISANINCLLSPKLYISRSTDENLYTYEGSISKSFDLGIANLGLNAGYGSTDLVGGGSRTYGGISGKVSKTFDNVTLHTDVSLIDVEDLDVDTVVTAGITFKF